ncbi:uncharacterized protein LOC129766382 [Toxorhynchites rutilus septentrionalis]|uniref:uncharacterized protein LOC129766382 n=1 Tax=Toxorhynchites rutilus septentrionalis TaxID=329112 RepID=UPI00247ACDDC|nr:uncharacterized protein LOC129766382 [Toxorhynchites rutilus septentrionalis]
MPAVAESIDTRFPSLRYLKVKLRDVQSSLTDIWRFVKNFSGDVSISGLEVRLEKLDQLWDEFGEVRVEVRAHDDFEGSDELDTERQEFSDRYYEAKSFLVGKLKDSTRTGRHSGQCTLDRVRLPQITLQPFNGNGEEWLSFKDVFTSLIHSRGDLPEVKKLYYLKGCLQGEPKMLIDSLQITAGNYLIACSMLLGRYDNNKQLKKRQVESLFKLPSLTRESARELDALLSGVERTTQTLDQIVQPAEYKDLLLINMITTRLDPVTRRDWEEFSVSKDHDTLKDLLDFLQRRVRVLDSLPTRMSQPEPSTSQGSPTVTVMYNTAKPYGKCCAACSAYHSLHKCKVFRQWKGVKTNHLPLAPIGLSLTAVMLNNNQKITVVNISIVLPKTDSKA